MSTTLASQDVAPQLLFVAQNNRGLTYLQNGDIMEARSCFTDALRGAQVGLHRGQNDSAQPPQPQEDPGAPNVITTEQHEQRPHQTLCSSSALRQQLLSRLRILPTCDTQDQAISIYMDMSQASSANMALIYAVIIYNMGVVYHVRGQECKSWNILDKAMELYQKALSIVLVELEPTSIMSRSSRNPIVDLLRMLMLKHMADIHVHRSDFESARACGDELAAFISSVGCFLYRDSTVTDLMQTQVACFLMYSYSLDRGSLMAPAA